MFQLAGTHYILHMYMAKVTCDALTSHSEVRPPVPSHPRLSPEAVPVAPKPDMLEQFLWPHVTPRGHAMPQNVTKLCAL